MRSSGLADPSMMTFVPSFSCACRTLCPDSETENNSTKPNVAQSDRIAPRASLYRRMGKIVCMPLLAANARVQRWAAQRTVRCNRLLAGASSMTLTFESFTRPVSFAPHPPCDEVIDLLIGMLDRFRWHTDDRLRRWIHEHGFSVTDFARIRRRLPVIDGWTVENDFSGEPRGFGCG